MSTVDLDHVRPLQEELNAHPIYAAIQELADLRVFMSHHIFSVWDFMSLIKYLQGKVAPTDTPWMPHGDPSVRYFINQLVLEEESDRLDLGDGPTESSHFELYCRAMDEIGADGGMPLRFIDRVQRDGLDEALYSELVPVPARYFCETTFCFIREDKPHAAAAALAVGRERIIPDMFRRILADSGVGADQAPIFHAYLNRHIHLDEDFHGPLSLKLLDHLCAGDPQKIEQAATAAEEAICARIRFWDGVLEAIRG